MNSAAAGEAGAVCDKPYWLKKRVAASGIFDAVDRYIRGRGIETVCFRSRCPNIRECFAEGRATFLILGRRCTRGCAFCAVENARPADTDASEPGRVAGAVMGLGMRYVIVTSVTRDDLPDGGASHYAEVIKAVRALSSDIRVEALVPDFKGDETALMTVLDAGVDVLGHNIETVKRLYPAVRPGADYGVSLRLLGRASAYAGRSGKLLVKSGFMAGLGETRDEVRELLRDIRAAGCDMITIGHYLRPRGAALAMKEFVSPGTFDEYGEWARLLGFGHAESGPFVRSSYRAEESYRKAMAKYGGSKAT